MQYCVDHPEEISKLAKVKAQVTEVKGVMMENIEKVEKSYFSFLLHFWRCNLEVKLPFVIILMFMLVSYWCVLTIMTFEHFT